MLVEKELTMAKKSNDPPSTAAEIESVPDVVSTSEPQWATLKAPLGVVPEKTLKGYQMSDGSNLYLNSMTTNQRKALLALERGCEDQGIANSKSAAVRYLLDQIAAAMGLE